jgi:hypothetical protein
MNNYKIHEVQASDLKMLHRFARACFVDTYASQNTPENMDLYLRDEFSEERILQLLTDSEIKFFLSNWKTRWSDTFNSIGEKRKVKRWILP